MDARAYVLGALALVAGCGKKSPSDSPTTGSAAAAENTVGAKLKKLVHAGHAKPPNTPGPAAHGMNAVIAPSGGVEKPEQPDKGHLTLAYAGVDSPARKMVRASGVFEQIVPELDKALNLPHDIPITFAKCEEENAFYSSENIAITMCDELVDYYATLFDGYKPEDKKAAIIGSLVSVFIHELGHGLIDQLQLPAVGKQEDAVDQLSTIVLVASGDEGNRMALDGAYSWVAEGDTQKGPDTTPFWDEHSLNEQRFYNIMCLIYGSNPDAYADVITDQELPTERADQCGGEYEAISGSWNKLLEPYLSVPTIRMTIAKPK